LVSDGANSWGADDTAVPRLEVVNVRIRTRETILKIILNRDDGRGVFMIDSP
jgi:hypothetical protein